MSDEAEAAVGVEAEAPVVETVEVAVLRARLVQAELRTAAARAGMIDLDGIKLVDTAGLAVNTAGELVEAAAVIAQLKDTKPWLFGRGSSSSAALAPRATPAKPKTAMEMSVEEWRVARAELLRRR